MAGKESLKFEIDVALAPGAKSAFVNQFNALGVEGQQDLIKAFDKSQIKQEIVFEPIFEGTDVNKVLKGWNASLQESGSFLDKLNQKTNDLKRTQGGSLTNLRQLVNTYKQQRDYLNPIITKVDELGRKVKLINPEWDIANQKVQQFSRQLAIAGASNFWEKLKAEFNLGPLLAAGRAVNELVNTFQSLSIIIGQVTAPVNALIDALGRVQQIGLLFESIGQGPADVAKVFADSSRIALTYGTSLNAVREGFAQLTPTVLGAGGTLDDVSNILDALSSRFAVFGLSAEKSKRVMNGVIQAFGKGKLMAEEFTQQISEADPAIRTDLAGALNVTVAELGEMIKAGQITSDVLIEILPKVKKTSSTFGELGTSALSAAAALLKGKVTIEQVRNQIDTLNQLNVENLANLFKPLLTSFLAIQAALTDFVTNLLKLEATRFLIELFNSLGLVIAGTVVVVTQFITAVLQLVQPIFGAVNSIDSFIQKLIGVRPIVTAIAALLLVGLTQSLVSTVLSFSKVTAAINLFSGVVSGTFRNSTTILSTGIKAIQSGFNGIRGAAASGITSVIRFGEGLAGLNSKQIEARLATQAYRQSLSYLPQNFVNAATSGQALASATNNLSKSGKAAGDASQKLATNVGAQATATQGAGAAAQQLAKEGFQLTAATGAVAIVALAAAYAWIIYERNTKSARAENENLKSSLEGIRNGLRTTETSFSKAAIEIDDFTDRMTNAKTVTNDLFDYVLNNSITGRIMDESDEDTIVQISEALRVVNQALQDTEPVAKKASAAIAAYNSETASSEQTALVVAQAKATVQSYDQIIASAKKLRAELEKKAKTSGKGLTEEERQELILYNAVIDNTIRKRKELIEAAKAKGIPLGIDITGVDVALDTVGELQETLKSFKEIKASAQIGTTGAEKVQSDIKAIEGILKALETDFTEVKIKVKYDTDKASFENALSYGEALLDNYKAQEAYKQAGFDLTKAEAQYKVQAAEDELSVLKDREAGAGVIKAKEAEIANLKNGVTAIERQAILARIQGLAAAQQQERQILALKQQQQQLEAQAAVAQAQRVLNESKLAQAKAEQNLADAKAKGVSQEQINALQNIVNKTKEQVTISGQILGIEQQRQQNLSAVQGLERSTLDYKQKTEKATLDAQAAQLGLNTAIKTGAGDVQQISNGFVEVGGKVTELYTKINNGNQTAATSYGTVTSAANTLSGAIGGIGGQSNSATSAVTAGSSQMAGALRQVQSPVADLESSLGGVAGAAESAKGNVGDLKQELDGTKGDTYTQINTDLQGTVDSSGKVTTNLQDAGSKAKDLGAQVSPLSGSLNDAATASSGLNTNISTIPQGTLDKVQGSFSAAATSAGAIEKADIAGSVSSAQTPARDFASSMDGANTAVQGVSDKLKALDGTKITVNVDVRGGLPGYWTGGPIASNTLARVNELGKEAFLSASGRLSMINQPANSTWRAPSSGTIIPAHLTSLLKIPRGGVNLPSGTSSRFHRATRGTGGGRSLERAITSALRGSSSPVSNGYEARSQAAQALQLGRLTAAINELTRKNWNVDVKVRNTGNAAYLDALNQRL